jgi:hypothetical protein
VQKKLAADKKAEAAAGRRAEAESAAADVLRAGIAAEEALESLQRSRGPREAGPRPGRLPLVAAVLAIALAAGVFWLYPREAAQAPERPAGEPLELRLDYRLTSARTPG